ncbi:hypothetical protein HMPREF1215_00758 [Coprococcus sp. HPP0074]|jgi:hypothetical protein|nr:hypothetical protein HMPREF1215_00758 [Coprococcus sp. HPP0074]
MDKEEWKNQIANEYCGNNMRKLRKICDKILKARNIPKEHWESFYDRAVDIFLESINSYDDSKECKFNTYFYGNLRRRTGTWFRDNFRFKRCNLERDFIGNIIKDEKGNPTIIPNVSIHMKVDPEEDCILEEIISSNYNLEREIMNKLYPTTDRVELYKSKLSYSQQLVVDLMCAGYTENEILSELHISREEYKDKILDTMKLYENVKVLLRE